ncbi:GNAT family N-acetyltransferase [Bacillus sp. WLY-B-L8]|uniref:GNAT family N-acetyltransferase n=1 Tax=Bacillus multifaciens TaxID=3068506 RepID=UPI0027416AE7|nr:GNAT family N-acetyltransferase [Bacillus sp. WLY-B-L8]MDP7980455.1 GNAT family N-acetyltransferase [Bacillus sp. WLY-B-L8]
MNTRIKQLSKELDYQEFIKKIIELWNMNAIETAECELDESDRMGIHEQLEQFVQSKYGAVFVVTDEGQDMIGYGIASIKQDLVTDTLYGQIDEVYIREEYRRQQIAKNLVEYLTHWLNQESISSIQVYVDLDNKLALNFWENTGFEKEFFLLSNS